MKEYCFNLDIIGRCTISVEAENKEKAIENINNNIKTHYELIEWGAVFPNNDEELKKHISYESEI